MSQYKILIVPIMLLSSVLGSTTLVHAETLSIINAPANSSEGIQRPERGQTQQEVENFFGSPLEKIDAVGQPPISRWVYEKYTVYFEDEYVIHSAVHH